MKRRIVISVTYDEASVHDEEDLRRSLERSIEHHIEYGLLSTEESYIVDDWSYEIEEVT